MRIRKARKEDLPSIIELGYELLTHHVRYSRYYTPIKSRKRWNRVQEEYFHDMLESRDALLLVAEDKGSIIGYSAGLIKRNPPVLEEKYKGEVEEVYVKKEYRKKGIGRRLTEEVIEWLKRRKIRRVVIEFDAGNRNARQSYKKAGFRPFREIFQTRI